VQWHPEFHIPDDPDNFDDAPLLHDFLQAARATRAQLETQTCPR
jgi:putative glutamine amidotransferase